MKSETQIREYAEGFLCGPTPADPLKREALLLVFMVLGTILEDPSIKRRATAKFGGDE